MAGKATISVELNESGKWIGQWKPIYADDHPPEVPEDVTETGEALWDTYRLETRQFHQTELTDLEDYAWQAAGEQCGLIEALDQFEWLPEIMPVTAWDKDLNWQSLIRKLADDVRCAIEADDR
jgi:hypothetical protein